MKSIWQKYLYYITEMMCRAQFWTTLGQGHTDSFKILIYVYKLPSLVYEFINMF
jgi:hypothetical protein